MPKKDDDKIEEVEPKNPATASHRGGMHEMDAEATESKLVAMDDAKDEKPKPAPKAKADPKPEPEPAPPQQRIEDLLKDKTFDPEGTVRSQLAALSVHGEEFAPADLVAQASPPLARAGTAGVYDQAIGR